MKKPEEFNNWIKQQIEENPQLPPEAAWEHISEAVELEDAWQGISQDLELDNLWSTIDTRLHVHQHLKVWELSGASITAAVAMILLFLPLYFQLSAEQAVMAHKETATEQQSGSNLAQGSSAGEQAESVENHTAIRSTQGRNGSLNVNTLSSEASSRSGSSGVVPSQRLDEKFQRGRKIQREEKGVMDAEGKPETYGQATNTSGLAIKNTDLQSEISPLFHGLTKDVLRAETLIASLTLKNGVPIHPMLQKANVIVDKKEKSRAGKSLRIGLGASGRISWLLNEKTYQGMEKSSLITPIPSYRKSVSIQAEKIVSAKLSLLADLMLYSETGQRYREYQSGVYGETNTELRYTHLNILAAYSLGAMGYGTKSHTRLIAGLSGGWLQSAVFKGPLGVTDVRDDYKNGSAAVVLGYEYTMPLMRNIWMGYGLRGHLDLFNIYGNKGELSPAFSQTRNAFLDFTISFKYDLKNK